MLTMNEDLEGALKAYLLQMEKGAYYEAHELLEEAWHPLRLKKEPLANLTKGLINVAIAGEHIRRGREQYAQRARRVMGAYERHKHLCVKGIANYSLFLLACKKAEALKEAYPTVFTPSS